MPKHTKSSHAILQHPGMAPLPRERRVLQIEENQLRPGSPLAQKLELFQTNQRSSGKEFVDNRPGTGRSLITKDEATAIIRDRLRSFNDPDNPNDSKWVRDHYDPLMRSSDPEAFHDVDIVPSRGGRVPGKNLFDRTKILRIPLGNMSDKEMPTVRKDPEALHGDVRGGDAYANRAISAIRDVLPFTKAHEGFRENAYKDSQGVWTVGYGQTTINGRPVKEGDTISEKNASVFVQQRIRENAYSMYKRHPWMEKLSQNALAAAYDLAYNLGDGIFTKENSPGFNRRLAAGEDPEKVLWSEYGTYLGGKDATPETRKGLKNRRDDAVKKWKV